MSRKVKRTVINALLTLVLSSAYAQSTRQGQVLDLQKEVTRINWMKPSGFQKQGKTQRVLAFENVSYFEEKSYLPYLFLTTSCSSTKLVPEITAVEVAALSAEEESCVNKIYLTNDFEILETQTLYAEKIPQAYAKMVPLRINKQSGKIEKLVAYSVNWRSSGEEISLRENPASALFVSNSVLATGKWYKIGTTDNAIYKIDKAFLQKLGINTSSVDPRNIQIYGNGGEMLTEKNNSFHYDDLNENAIFVQGESDGSFDNTDYILFYGQSPHKWKYNAGAFNSTSGFCTPRYSRIKHFYSDTVFYFLTVGTTPGKRVQQQVSSTLAPTYTVTGFDDCQFHEYDGANLVKSGREMYGENFENQASYSFNFGFPSAQNDTVWIKASILGRRPDPGIGLPSGAYDINYPGGSYTVYFTTTCADYDCDVGKDLSGCSSQYFINSGSSNISVSVNRKYSDESGWLNYLWVMARRNMTMIGNQMPFMDYRSIGAGTVSQYNLSSSISGLRIWDVTNGITVAEQQTTFSSGMHSFVLSTDTLRKFIAFDGSNYKTPTYSAEVPNQDLHSVQPVDYVVVAHPMFLSQAQQLADLHARHEKFTSVVVTPQQIYNEFSSGAQDISAIRLFMRMLYKRATSGNGPKHLLIYGDASYNLKDLNTNTNSNLVPTYQSYNSASYISSKCGDDFYGLLDDNEGQYDCCGNPDGIIDIGIGRLTVRNVSEGDIVLNKIQTYYARKIPTSSSCEGVNANAEDWRNWVCLIADDLNPGAQWELTFVTQSESFASSMGANKRYNIDKIYEDAYKVVTVPGGRRYPDVVNAINSRVARGALVIGYSGHGGELGLSHEEIVTVNQIKSWNNINNLPLFFTATCEFSRYDDPGRTSAGEYALLNPEGGAIGLFSTTRLAFASDGISLGSIFYPTAVNKLSDGKYPTMGDIIRKTKQVQPNYLHFALLGDPGLTLSYPKENVTTSKINNKVTVTGVADTLSALGKYTVTGFIADTNGNKINTFNGTIYPTIFDKPVLLSLLDNGNNGISYSFYLQKNAIYRGKASVVNGDFSFTCIIPKDIMYNFGLGKISYYAQADTTDAAGYYVQAMVGGTSTNPVSDNVGPGVKLFMNDNQFVSGGLTNTDPYIYAEITDSSGINTTGNGLGHDIVATLDGNSARAYVLNDYYQSDLNKYQSGKIKYQVNNLTEGTHHMNLKVWDILNNSSTSATNFVVAKSAEVALAHVLNYPNPFSTATKFFVEHNQNCDELDVQVQVFTITGRIVKTLQQTVQNEGFRTVGIDWDGRDDYGDKLAKGVYIYKVTVRNGIGSKADKIEKLVILN